VSYTLSKYTSASHNPNTHPCAVSPANKHFPKARPDSLTALQGVIDEAHMTSVAPGTRQNMATAVTKFLTYLSMELGMTDLTTLDDNSDPAHWDEETKDSRTVIMLGYAASVSRNHRNFESTKTYVHHVTKWWTNTFRSTLWDPTHNGGLKVFFAGLEKMRQECSTNPREGYSFDDINTLNAWTTMSNPALRGKGRPTTLEELANIRAARQMAWQLLYRLGELLPPDTPENPWKPEKRLTRADIRVIKDHEGRVVALSCPTPQAKVINEITRNRLTMTMDESAQVNAAHAILQLFELDPIPESDWATTPLFRDGRTGPKGARPLSSKRVRQIDHKIWRDCVKRDVGKGPGAHRYGGHSYRIGGATTLMEKGCPPLTLQGMGRWVSSCYTLYLRVGTEILHRWQRAMAENNPGQVPHVPGIAPKRSGGEERLE
jgi:hypothetical protein